MYASVQQLRADIIERVGRGQHLLLYGPRGSGKSRLVAQLHERFLRSNIPCAIAHSTSCLGDVTRALQNAYPDVNIEAVSRRTARYRLWSAADRRRCVLLLDHLSKVNPAMVGFLRRLRGGIAGVLFVVDVDVERERVRMRRRAKSLALSVRMPHASIAQLRALLHSKCPDYGRSLEPRDEQLILRAAQGRPGWIVLCTALMSDARYWHQGHLYAHLLCTDAEISLRQRDLKLLAPEGWSPACGRLWPSPLTDYDEEGLRRRTRPAPTR